MSVAIVASSAENAGRFFLRWSDSPDLPVREEPVEVIGYDSSQPIIRSAFRISENTAVFLIDERCTKSGFVQSCREEADYFLLVIQISSEYAMPELLPQYDPGFFAVDDFLTEEEETKILDGLKRDKNDDGGSSKGLSRLLRLTRTACKAFNWRLGPFQRRTGGLLAYL